jgi:hypothetical protein
MSNIQSIVDNFANQLNALIEAQVVTRARDAVAHALGGVRGKRGPGRPPKLVSLALASATLAGPKGKWKKPRKKAPPQLCPVPGCKNRAAPIFGMVCSEHKNVAKSKIKAYRAARKAKKTGAAGGKKANGAKRRGAKK